MHYASLPDVEVEYGPVPPEQADRVEALIARAEAILLFEVRDLDARIVTGQTQLPLVKQVVSEMVTAVLRNPQGLKSFAHTEGPFTTSGTYADTSGGGMVLTDRHRRLLGLPASTSGAFTITPGRRS
ncbi:MAG: hypothetical protein AVDCRST_MAG68-5033 [uncultured Gemmatimonadetes bacterium]|uniref:Head-to-tail adaptor n=1 Tax=uncultured Gemmatimonadota bacterium TaxID=203437 RepID=A0A6J4MQC6_9BACT|nr:MAG: hypothetical protein AVDCRST_MAG68-5033 [uncultured Gemmatimonadota bacterium]